MKAYIRIPLGILLIIGFFLIRPGSIHALGLPFGGLVAIVSFEECDCPATIGNANIYFATADPVPSPVTIGEFPLTYVPYLSIPTYSYYVLPVPGVYLLGDFFPGPGECWYYIPPYECGLWPGSGILHSAGTSL